MLKIIDMVNMLKRNQLVDLPEIIWIKMDPVRLHFLTRIINKSGVDDNLRLSTTFMYRLPDRVLASTIKGN